jgi:hypothetical protein
MQVMEFAPDRPMAAYARAMAAVGVATWGWPPLSRWLALQAASRAWWTRVEA